LQLFAPFANVRDVRGTVYLPGLITWRQD
jgi:hypothetical protein